MATNLQKDFFLEKKIQDQKEEAYVKAIEALSGYKFWMFGYHAARWVQLNRLTKEKDPNPFADFVITARSIIDATNDAGTIDD